MVKRECYIGEYMSFDGIRSEPVSTGAGCVIISRTKELICCQSVDNDCFLLDNVHIGNRCCSETNALIINKVYIYDVVIVDPGGTAPKDISSKEVLVGNSVRFLKKRNS